MILKRLLFGVNILLIISSVFAFSLWTCNHGNLNFTDLKDSSYPSKYNLLTNAFQQKRLHNLDAPPGLKKLKDPYDPAENREYRRFYYDYSYYKDKLYVYFGITPVLCFYLPYLKITKLHPSEGLVLLVFSTLLLLSLATLIIYIKRRAFPEIPNSMIYASVFTLGICNYSVFSLREPSVYNIVIIAGAFFSTLMLYFFIRCSNSMTAKIPYAILGSLCLGLAIGCRPFIVIPGTLITLFLIIRSKENILKSPLAYALLIPSGVIICGLLIYNYLRFDNFLEFGRTYMIDFHPKGYPRFSTDFIKANLFSHFLQPIIFFPKFPFFFPNIADLLIEEIGKYQFREKMVGMFNSIPFTALITLFPILLFSKIEKFKKEFFIIFFYAATNIAFLLPFYYVTLRYASDYISMVLVCCIVIWFHLYTSIKDQRGRLVLNTIVYLLMTISVLQGAAFSLTGTYSDFMKRDRVLFSKTEKIFKPIENLLLKFIDYDENKYKAYNLL